MDRDPGTHREADRPAPPRRADARRNEELLLKAAAEVFAEKGVDGSLEEVARRAGVGIGTLYRRFPSREVLVEALFAGDVAALKARAEDLLRQTDTGTAIRRWFSEFAAHVTTFRGLSALFVHGLCAKTELSEACDAMLGSADSLLRKARAEGVVRASVRTRDLVALVNALAWTTEQEQGKGAGSEASRASMARLLDIVLSGAFAPERSGRGAPPARLWG